MHASFSYKTLWLTMTPTLGGGNIAHIFFSSSLRKLIDQRSFIQYNGAYENNNQLAIKANFLHWRIMLDRVPTRSSLLRRGVDVGTTLCPICNQFDEDLQHLFAFCLFACQLWSQIGVWLKLSLVPSSSLNTIMDVSLLGFIKDSTQEKVIDSILKTALWSIWCARNNRIFRSYNPNTKNTMDKIKILIFLWVKNRSKLGWVDWSMWSTFNFMHKL